MRTTCDFLDAVKARYNLPSDYALAKKLDMTTQMVSQYRKGKDFLSDSRAIQIANLLEIDSGIVAAAIHEERAKTEQEKAMWRGMLERLGGIAASVLIGLGGLSAPAPAQASNADQVGTMCIMLNLERNSASVNTNFVMQASNPATQNCLSSTWSAEILRRAKLQRPSASFNLAAKEIQA